MVTRYKRSLATYYVLTDAVLGIAAFLGAYVLRFKSDLIPVTKGVPPLEQYLFVVPFVGAARAGGLLLPGPLQRAAEPFAGGRLLRGLRRQRRGRRPGRGDHALLPGLLRAGRHEGPRRVRGLPGGVGAVPGAERRPDVRLAGGRAPDVRAPVARRHRAEAHPDRRRGRARPARGGQDPRAPRTGLPRGGLRRRPRREGPPRLPRAAAARHDRRDRRDLPARADRSDLRGPAARRAPPHARGHRGRRQEPDRREDRPGPAAVHRAAGPHRGPGRRPDHQPQRRAASGPQRPGQAGHRPGRLRRRPPPPRRAARDRGPGHPARRRRARSSTGRSG